MARRMTNFRSAAIATGNAINDSAYDTVKKVSDKIEDVSAVNGLLLNGDFITVAEHTTDIAKVSSNMLDIVTVASDMDNILDNMPDITLVSSNMELVSAVSPNIDNINTVNNNIDSINNTSNNIVNINSVSSNIDNINLVSNNIDAINSTSTNIDSINSVVDNMDTINNVEARAIEAAESAIVAQRASNYRGEWEAGTYEKGDIARYGTNMYVVVTSSTTEEPSTGTEWEIITESTTQDYIFTVEGTELVISSAGYVQYPIVSKEW